MATDFKDTLNLPKTSFPMRAGLTKREPERVQQWQKIDLYGQIQQHRASSEKTFLLHDGPPFTNGDVHIGTALNKVLKDVIVRYQAMRGYRAPYVPGWDCHGLPIEFKVSKELQAEGSSLEPLELRQRCAAFSRSFIEKQRGQFQRLGVLGDWAREYRTMDGPYEAETLKVLASMVEQGMVYRSKKPVYWSIPCGTALAEAEVEYKDHKSPAVFVKMPVVEATSRGLPEKTSMVIWTTTPWTLPANLGIAVHPAFSYVEVEHDGETYLLEERLAPGLIEKFGWYATPGTKHTGESLKGLSAKHPFLDRESLILTADYVTAESGTGAVHLAPGHGLEDYLVGLENGLEVYNPVQDDGTYADDGRIPPELVGVTVLETDGWAPANGAVLKLLDAAGTLLKKENHSHSYPFCWRSKTPVVFRAVDQWFVGVDRNDARQKALGAIDEVKWLPDWGKNRIFSSVEGRPDWVISRQRSWGVPIPAFFDDQGHALLDGAVIRRFADLVSEHGTDLWFARTADELADLIGLPEEWKGRTLKKGTDTMDVWIESGASHQAVLRRYEDLPWPADLYLEGTDQHRGWFQSSLWSGIVTEGAAPYRTVITHGFIVDEDRQKISKSGDKPMTADSFVEKYGADVIRLWISSQDYRNDVPVSDEILGHVLETYRTIRNTLRYQLSNLYDFEAERDLVAVEEMLPLERWTLGKLAELVDGVTAAYDSFEFHRVYQLVRDFCAVTLSRYTHDMLKDRLYTFRADSLPRRSAQSLLHHVFATLNGVLAPILAFTSDEAHSYRLTDTEWAEHSVALTDWPEVPESWRASDIVAQVDAVLAVREDVNEQLETLRKEKTIGKSLDAAVTLQVGAEHPASLALRTLADHLPELFIVSQVDRQDIDGSGLTILAQHAEGERCPRCWRWVKQLQSTPQGELCDRCTEATAHLEPVA